MKGPKSGVDSETVVEYGNGRVIPAQVVFQEAMAPEPDGLRSRKKLRTRLAIQDATLDLFAERGFESTTIEEIAARAEVGTTTFFAYFPSKSDVIVSDHDRWLPALQQAIVDAPASEHDLDAIRQAIEEQWIAAIDLERTVRQAQAIATSHVLRGISYDIGQLWLEGVADTLARRHGLGEPDDRCWITGRVALTTLGHALWAWMRDGCPDDLGARVDHAYRIAASLDAPDVADRPRPLGTSTRSSKRRGTR